MILNTWRVVLDSSSSLIAHQSSSLIGVGQHLERQPLHSANDSVLCLLRTATLYSMVLDFRLSRSLVIRSHHTALAANPHVADAGQPMASGGEWRAISDLMSAPVPLLRSCLLPEDVLTRDGVLVAHRVGGDVCRMTFCAPHAEAMLHGEP